MSRLSRVQEAAAIEQRVVEANARANAPSVVRTKPLQVGGSPAASLAAQPTLQVRPVPRRRLLIRAAIE